MTTILTKKKDTTGAPAPGDLTNAAGGAELAVNTFDKRLYTKDSGGNVVEIGTNPTILNIDNIEINGNTISSTNSNGNINLTPNGTGSVVVSKLQVTGTFQLDGNVTVGDTSADTLTVNSTITSNLIFTDNTYDIGASGATRPRTGYFGTSVISPLFVAGAGTVSAPAITTTGDLNTGIFFPAADTIAFTEGGVESMRIDSSGNVGIGTSSPSQKLDVSLAQNNSTLVNVTNTNSGASSRTGFSANSDTVQTNLYATASGYTAVAAWQGAGVLSVGSGSTNGLILNCEGQPIKFSISRTEAMRIDSSGNVLVGTTTASYSGANRGNITVGGTSSSILAFQVNSTNSGYIYHDGTTGGMSVWNAVNSPMYFATNNTERMRIDSSGNVGIGTSSPSTKLTVAGDVLVTGGGVYYLRDTTTYTYSPSSGVMTFITNSAERMRIDSSGRLGLGNSATSPTSLLFLRDTNDISFTMSKAGVGGFDITNAGTSGVTLGTQDPYMLAFKTNNTERMRITSTGLVGIGNSSPSALLHVTNNSNTYAGGILIGSAGIASGHISTTDNLYIKPNTAANTTSGAVFVQDFSNANKIALSSVNGTIGLGGANAASTGVGITFPATQSASSDANTLDDYEEGDWTPTITASSSNPTVTYVDQTGKYTKIGRMVSIQGRLQISAISGGSGNFRLSGLPFANAANIVGAGTSWFSGVDLSAGYTMASLYFAGNDAFLSLAQSGDNVGATQMAIGVIGATFDIAFAFTYITS